MARLACALAVIAASVANAFDYQVEVSSLGNYEVYGSNNINAMVSSEQGLLYALFEDDTIAVINEDNGEIVETLDGDTVEGYNMDGDGIAIDHEGELLFVGGDGCIRVIDVTTNEYTSWQVGICNEEGHVDGEGTSARIGFVESMVIDAADMHLYILDTDYDAEECSVRKVHIESGEVETLRESECTEPGTQRDDTMETIATFSLGYYIDVHGEHIYLSEYDTGAIRRMDIDHPHSVELVYGTYNTTLYCGDDEHPEGMCGGAGLETVFGNDGFDMNFAVDDFGEWIFVADGGSDQIYQCTMHPHIEDTECEVIAGDLINDHVNEPSEFETDAVGTNAAFFHPTAICHGQEHSEDFYVADRYWDGAGSFVRLLTLNDLRHIENESPKFTIGVFVAGGVAALLAGFAILNAAPVA